MEKENHHKQKMVQKRKIVNEIILDRTNRHQSPMTSREMYSRAKYEHALSGKRGFSPDWVLGLKKNLTTEKQRREKEHISIQLNGYL